MKFNEKRELSILKGTGTGIQVVDGDINFALQLFKRNIKESEKLVIVHNKKHYIKKSDKRRKLLEEAKFKQRNESKKQQ